MVVNFRIHKISRGAHKLHQTPTLIQKYIFLMLACFILLRMVPTTTANLKESIVRQKETCIFKGSHNYIYIYHVYITEHLLDRVRLFKEGYCALKPSKTLSYPFFIF
jgi:hypothetical protein